MSAEHQELVAEYQRMAEKARPHLNALEYQDLQQHLQTLNECAADPATDTRAVGPWTVLEQDIDEAAEAGSIEGPPGAGLEGGVETFPAQALDAAANMDAILEARLPEAGLPGDWDEHARNVMSLVGRWPL